MTHEEIQTAIPDYENKLTARIIHHLTISPEGVSKAVLVNRLGGLVLEPAFDLILDRLITDGRITTAPKNFVYKLNEQAQ
jgi:hypothetical protein